MIQSYIEDENNSQHNQNFIPDENSSRPISRQNILSAKNQNPLDVIGDYIFLVK